MAKSTNKTLSQNPFTAYRDPKTGEWVVIHNSQPGTKNYSEGSDSASGY